MTIVFVTVSGCKGGGIVPDHGFVRQEDVPLDSFLANRFGRVYAMALGVSEKAGAVASGNVTARRQGGAEANFPHQEIGLKGTE